MLTEEIKKICKLYKIMKMLRKMTFEETCQRVVANPEHRLLWSGIKIIQFIKLHNQINHLNSYE